MWTDRPSPSRSPLLALPAVWTGQTAVEKIARLREDMAEAGAQAMVLVKLDQIAWLLNLRSEDDVPFNPVFESYLVLDGERVRLFLTGGAIPRVTASFAIIKHHRGGYPRAWKFFRMAQ